MLLGFNNSNINRLAQTAEFGIERESLRVTSDGKLAQTVIRISTVISAKIRWR